MTQRDNKLNASELDALFEAARDVAFEPSDDFMTRLMADADTQIVAQGTGLPEWAAPKVTVTKPWRARIFELLGGWGGATGLATATVAGLVLGFGAPMTVSNLTTGHWAVSSTTESFEATNYVFDDLIPSFYDLAVEG